MTITLRGPFAADTGVAEDDARAIKVALNHLGYYQPLPKVGMNGIPDRGSFAALKKFQKDQGIRATGTAKPGDETIQKLNQAIKAQAKRGENYIWRTMMDSLVRPDHWVREGVIFSCGNPPEGGAPGEDHNCRCYAERVNQQTGLEQTLISTVNDAKKWTEKDFINHLKHGEGRPVMLHKIGYLQDVINKAEEIMYHRVEEQVAEKMREIQSGNLVYTTDNSYAEFKEVFWVFGGSTIRTKTEGFVTRNGNLLSIVATVDYEYDDLFTDPSSIREWTLGTSNPKDAPDWYVDHTDGGTYFQITDKWKTAMTGSISLENNKTEK